MISHLFCVKHLDIKNVGSNLFRYPRIEKDDIHFTVCFVGWLTIHNCVLESSWAALFNILQGSWLLPFSQFPARTYSGCFQKMSD